MKTINLVFIPIIICFCTVTILLAKEQVGQTALYHLDNGDKFHDSGNIEEAHQEYLKSLKYLSSKNEKVRAFGSLTVTFFKKEEYFKANIYCKKLLQIAPKSKWAHEKLKIIQKNIVTNKSISEEATKKNIALQHNSGLVQFTQAQFLEKNKKYDKAFYWYKKAAEENNLQAQIKVADAYAKGVGISKNTEEAYTWYRRAAEQGSPYAATKLGDIFYDDKEYNEAVKWYAFASSKKGGLASEKLAKLYLYGKGVEKDSYKARTLLLYAEKVGHTLEPKSNMLLAYYYYGTFIPDYDEAKRRFLVAYRSGIPEALKYAKECEYLRKREIEREERINRSHTPETAKPEFKEVLAGIFALGIAVEALTYTPQDSEDYSNPLTDESSKSNQSSHSNDHSVTTTVDKLLFAVAMEISRRNPNIENNIAKVIIEGISIYGRDVSIRRALKELFPQADKKALDYMTRNFGTLMQSGFDVNSLVFANWRESVLQELEKNYSMTGQILRYADILLDTSAFISENAPVANK